MFDASNRALNARALGQPRGRGWGGRWEGVQDGAPGHPWLIHVGRSVQSLRRVRLFATLWTARAISMYGKNHHNIVKQLAAN